MAFGDFFLTKSQLDLRNQTQPSRVSGFNSSMTPSQRQASNLRLQQEFGAPNVNTQSIVPVNTGEQSPNLNFVGQPNTTASTTTTGTRNVVGNNQNQFNPELTNYQMGDLGLRGLGAASNLYFGLEGLGFSLNSP